MHYLDKPFILLILVPRLLVVFSTGLLGGIWCGIGRLYASMYAILVDNGENECFIGRFTTYNYSALQYSEDIFYFEMFPSNHKGLSKKTDVLGPLVSFHLEQRIHLSNKVITINAFNPQNF